MQNDNLAADTTTGAMPFTDPALRALLNEAAQKRFTKLEIFPSLPSANTYLLNHPDAKNNQICICNTQTAGRGRQGQRWIAAPDQHLLLACCLIRPRTESTWAQGLPLALGVAIIHSLHAQGLTGPWQLKWPNDLLFQGQKLGGILVETQPHNTQSLRWVIGIGLNIKHSPPSAEIDQRWTCLETVSGQVLSRTQVTAQLLNALAPLFSALENNQLTSYLEAWATFDALYNQRVCLQSGDETLSGIAKGINANGALRLQTAQGLRILTSAHHIRLSKPSSHPNCDLGHIP